MGGQQKDFISDFVFFQHQDGMRLKVRRHFLQCIVMEMGRRWEHEGKKEGDAVSKHLNMDLLGPNLLKN
jgi:hypothetical protein